VAEGEDLEVAHVAPTMAYFFLGCFAGALICCIFFWWWANLVAGFRDVLRWFFDIAVVLRFNSTGP